MVDKTPAEITSGTANDDSVVHASDADVTDFSRSHTERDISRLQGTAPLFSAAKTYNVNDLVTQNNIVYRNIVAIAVPAAFDAADWEPVATPNRFTTGTPSDTSTVFASEDDSATTPTKHNERDISRLQSAMLAYDSSKTYNAGDLVREVGFNWINITPIVVPEAFDPSKWAFIDNGLGIVFVAYNTDTAAQNEFFVVNGGDSTGDVDEDDAQAPVAGAFSLVFYTIQVQTNTRDNATDWVFRKNGADGNGIITVGTGLTGVFQDVTNTDDMVLGDLIAYQYRELVTTTGSLTIFGSSCATRRTET